MTEWTPKLVEDRLFEAADVLKRLPDIRVRGYYTLWPKIVPEFSDLVGQQPTALRRPTLSPEAVSKMEQTMTWLTWLEPQDAKLVWARADGARWKLICWRFGISRATAHRRLEYALSLIAWRLNGRQVPSKRSRQHLVERVRSVAATAAKI